LIETLKLRDEQIETFTYKHMLSESGRNSIREFINEFLAQNIIRLEWHDLVRMISSLSPLNAHKYSKNAGPFSEKSPSIVFFPMKYPLMQDKFRHQTISASS
jgi:hypothetical protein